MDRLRQLLTHISAQLGVLTFSQRVAIGLCAVLVVASVFWLMQWSVEPEYVPLVKAEFEYDQLTSAEDALKAGNVKYVVRGQRIFVRAEDRPNVLRILHQADVVPGEQLFDMETLVVNQNPFMSPEARRNQENYALGNELAKIVATSPLIERARVVINPVTQRRLGRQSDVPSASVAVTMASGQEMSQETVSWLAKLVSGAVSGLKPHNVTISDATSGRAFSVPRPEDALGANYLTEVKKRENHLLSKVLDALAHIPGVRATVTVKLDTRQRQAEVYEYDKPQEKKTTSLEDSSTSGKTPSESGVQANVGAALTEGPTGQQRTKEDSTTENYPGNLTKREVIADKALAIDNVTATVSIPRGFIVGIYQAAGHPDVEAPTEEQLAEVRDAQVSKVTAIVERIVMAEPGDVQVDIYENLAWDSPEGPAWGAVGPGPGAAQAEAGVLSTDTLRTYGPQVGLGVLALMSMFMMLRVVRKSATLVKKLGPIAEDDEDDEGGTLHVGPATVGEAAASESLLTGKEVDEETLRFDQLGTEVSRMVEDDPSGAADLIRRWVEETDQ